VGNARTATSFSATVRLLTAEKNIAGACVYASNYPPVGEYASATKISFTGTPDFKVVVRKSDGNTYTATVVKKESLSISNGETILSFTDKTGASGTFTCIPMTISAPIDFSMQPTIVVGGLPVFFSVTQYPSTPDVSAVTYMWSAPAFSPETFTGVHSVAYEATAPNEEKNYPVTLTARSAGYCDYPITKEIKVWDCLSVAGWIGGSNACSNIGGRIGI
jgi:hypothetical protein